MARRTLIRLQRRARRLLHPEHATNFDFPPVVHNEVNPVSRALLEGRRSDAHLRTHGIEEVRSLYADLFGSAEPVDPDRTWAVNNWAAEDALVGSV